MNQTSTLDVYGAQTTEMHMKNNTEPLVLIVEDTPEIAEMLTYVLEQEVGVRTRRVSTAFEAIFALDEITPDLFIIDYILPRMSGLDLVDQIRMIPGMQEIPIMMVSGSLPEEKLRARRIVGLDKPVDVNVLIHTVNNILHLAPTRAG